MKEEMYPLKRKVLHGKAIEKQNSRTQKVILLYLIAMQNLKIGLCQYLIWLMDLKMKILCYALSQQRRSKRFKRTFSLLKFYLFIIYSGKPTCMWLSRHITSVVCFDFAWLSNVQEEKLKNVWFGKAKGIRNMVKDSSGAKFWLASLSY